MKNKLIPMVWDDPEFFTNFGPTKKGTPSIVTWADIGSIWIDRPVDNEEEAYRLYKENHNSARANREWNWLNVLYNKTLGRIYGKVKEYE